MAIKSSDQVTIVDVTDAYSVVLTSEAYTFPGTTSAAIAGSTTTEIIAMQGAVQVPCSVVLSELTVPSGVTVTQDNNATTPTLTIAVSTSVTSNGNITIPVHIGSDIVINKIFSYAIAFSGTNGSAGKGITGTTVTYQASSSGTTVPTGTWTTSIPSVSASQYLWTRTVFNYTDSTSSAPSYSVGKMGDTGSTGKGISGTPSVTYQVGSSSTTPPTGTWASSVPATPQGSYLWTRTITNYTDSTSTTAYTMAYAGIDGADGANGANGADAISLSISSSNGFIFKNTAIVTVLTAHVYKAGAEVTGSALTALGTISWYKDGSSTAVATGQTLTINSGDVTGKATYTAQLA